jgi:L-iditol 2-dehydrogenase
MRAAVFYEPGKLLIEDTKLKEANEDELIVKVEYCAICGTDLRIYNSGSDKIKGTRIIGHEITGYVHETGKNVTDYKKGDKVVVAPVVACGKCDYCIKGKSNLCDNSFVIGYHVDGGFAEYVHMSKEVVNSGAIIKLHDDADLKNMSIAEPLSCVINGQEFLPIKPADTVLIIGGGPIGVMNALLAKAKGAEVYLTDVNNDRLQKVAEMGISTFLNKGELIDDFKENTGLSSVDFSIVACSVPQAQKNAVEIVKKGGGVSFFAGLPASMTENPIPTNAIHYKEITVYGANSSTVEQVKTACKLIETKIIDADLIITHEVMLDNIFEGFDLIKSGEAIKVAVKI